MGKRLIVTGADFSVNGIEPEFWRLAWIGGTTKNSADSQSGETIDLSQGQYISSGVEANINTRMVTEFILDSSTHSCYLTGCVSPVPASLYAWAQSAKIVAGMAYDVSGQSPAANSKDIFKVLWDGNKHTIDISKNKIVLDGTNYSWEHTPDRNSSTVVAPLYLDCCSFPYMGNYNSKAPQHGSGEDSYLKICRVKIYNDYADPSSLVVDAIPCKRVSDNKVGFYNLVNGEYFFRNNGSTPDFGTL